MLRAIKVLMITTGLILIVLFFMPMGTYSYQTLDGTYGIIWGWMLLIGYIGLISGFILLFYSNLKIKRVISEEKLLCLIGFTLLLGAFIQVLYLEPYLNFLNGSIRADIDFERMIIFPLFFSVSLWTIFVGFLVGFLKHTDIKINESL